MKFIHMVLAFFALPFLGVGYVASIVWTCLHAGWLLAELHYDEASERHRIWKAKVVTTEESKK